MQTHQKTPEHQAVYEKLRDMILFGRFAPKQPLTIHGLTEVLGAGMTPVREAIRRLTAENALEILENRRVVVPDLDRSQIDDIYLLRLVVEPELAARAAKVISQQQIEKISKIDNEINEAIARGDIETYLERNHAFHFAIYELANSPILLRSVQSFWLQVGPSHRVVCGRYGTARMPDKHLELLDALRMNDSARAAQATLEDLEQGLLLSDE